jgi:hypothetical protein
MCHRVLPSHDEFWECARGRAKILAPGGGHGCAHQVECPSGLARPAQRVRLDTAILGLGPTWDHAICARGNLEHEGEPPAQWPPPSRPAATATTTSWRSGGARPHAGPRTIFTRSARSPQKAGRRPGGRGRREQQPSGIEHPADARPGHNVRHPPLAPSTPRRRDRRSASVVRAHSQLAAPRTGAGTRRGRVPAVGGSIRRGRAWG